MLVVIVWRTWPITASDALLGEPSVLSAWAGEGLSNARFERAIVVSGSRLRPIVGTVTLR